MAAAVLRNFRDAIADAPDEVGAGVALITAPHHDFVPEPVRGQPVVGVLLCYAGPVEEGEAALRPLRGFGPPASTWSSRCRTRRSAAARRRLPEGCATTGRASSSAGCPTRPSTSWSASTRPSPSPLGSSSLLPGGGAARRMPAARRCSASGGGLQLPHHVAVVRPGRRRGQHRLDASASAAIQPFATGRVYVNFIGDEGEERVVAAYGAESYARLQAIKDRYDPGNLFRSSLNITPSRAR